ncbi:MAG TPA: hypothetical protein VGF69_00395 [Thermoanaerobaculia bacterium]
MNKVAEVLEALREERRRLLAEAAGVERAIAALQQVLGGDVAAAEPAPQNVAPVEPGGGATASEPAPRDGGTASEPAPRGPYADYGGFYAAAANYLAQAGEPKTSAEVAEALRAGGYPTRAKNFKASVRTMLNRALDAESYGIYQVAGGGRWEYRG